jgi:hypothetical protein
MVKEDVAKVISNDTHVVVTCIGSDTLGHTTGMIDLDRMDSNRETLLTQKAGL